MLRRQHTMEHERPWAAAAGKISQPSSTNSSEIDVNRFILPQSLPFQTRSVMKPIANLGIDLPWVVKVNAAKGQAIVEQQMPVSCIQHGN